MVEFQKKTENTLIPSIFDFPESTLFPPRRELFPQDTAFLKSSTSTSGPRQSHGLLQWMLVHLHLQKLG